MKRFAIFIIIVSLFFTFSAPRHSDAQTMTDYCQVPPYVIQNVAPNIMIVVDNSGSMFYFSYFDGFTTIDSGDDNLCANKTNPCTGFTTPGTYPDYKYYGYFDPDYWYAYSNNRFYPTAPKTGSSLSGARAKDASEWDGNFLNWLTMRRIDIIRKVLTGGARTSGEGSGYDRLIGDVADCDSRGVYKRIGNADLYTPYSGTRKIYVNTAGGSCNGSGSGTSSFSIRNDSGGGDGTGNEGTFKVAVRVPTPVEGILQAVVGTRARIGLTFYNQNASTPQGGYVRVSVGGGSLSSTVNEINLKRPDSNTPLAETLWTVAGYFAQQASAEGGPGPRYSTSDFAINNSNDPFNYGTSTSTRYPYCAKSYVLYITDGEPCADGNLPGTLSDYASGKSIYNCSGSSCPAVTGTSPETYSFPAASFPSCSAGGNVAGFEDVALWAHTTDLRNNPTLGKDNIADIQNLTLYLIFAFGKGSTLLRYTAINGGFEDTNSNNIPDLQSEWDNNGDGEPDTFYEADEGYALEAAVREAFSSILRRASSGTAASVLASGEGRGANLVQAIFYPKRRFGNDIISWTGENQNLWYYVDPFFGKSSLREDTTIDKQLHLKEDYVIQLYFDPTSQLTKANRFIDTDGDGAGDTQTTTVSFENLLNLWEAGKSLWSRDISADPRMIYTTINGTTFLAGGFSTANKATLKTYLNAADDTDAEYIIRYTQGEGLTTEDLDGDGTTDVFGIDRKGTCSLTTSTSCTINSDCPSGETCVADGIDDFRSRTVTIGSETHVWKLGDIVDSTPRIASWVPLNNYHTAYSDTTYNNFTNTTEYKERGMVFAGGNDGMLHAFNLGKLEIVNEQYLKARLTGTDIGKEMWAFIPKNALPYLKYMTDPEYCHTYSVDLPAYIFDASINGNPGDDKTVNSWRTILIGGMRFGGACKPKNVNCATATPNSVCAPVEVSSSSVGYSSYFALDVTDLNNPQLLWEFSDPELGFTTTGPAVVRIGDRDKNGSWFAVLGSGPTGPIDTTNTQFLGRSDQNLRLFVLDLKTGSLLRKIDTGIQYAFAGSMFNSTNDTDLNYKDDAIYIGYVKKPETGTTWTDGGVGRLFTKESTDTATWTWSKVIDGIGPVTSAIARLQNKNTYTLWLYFGTGRYYFVQGSFVDDADSQRTLYGIKEPCSSCLILFDPEDSQYNTCINECTISPVSAGDLSDVTDIADVPSAVDAEKEGFKGWYINLDAFGDYAYLEGGTSVTRSYKAERMITDPLATTTGIVFFTTFKPYYDECAIGGKTFLWATLYNTGGAGGNLLKGIALIQVSTAAIEQIDLSSAFSQKGGRCSAAMEGVPPTAQGLSLITMPPPVKRVIHVKER